MTLTISGQMLIDGEFRQATVAMSEGQIASIDHALTDNANMRTDGWIVPGFIDLQINGAFGFDFTADSESIGEVAARLPATGVTAFLPTFVTSPLEAYPQFLRDVEKATHEDRGALVLGAHLEGPYLNPKRVGAHNPKYLRLPSRDKLEGWAGSSLVRLATLAPELPNATDMIRELSARGIAVSVGHSDATFEQALAGFECGVSYGTHLFNAMSPLTVREPGLVGALLSSNFPVGLIADGVHVHPALVNLAFRTKGASGITLVTDAMAAMGSGRGRYLLGDREVLVDANSARLADGVLAGSILKMDAAIRNMTKFAGCSLADAVTMASATPAHVLGLERKGRIQIGYDADLVVLNKLLRVETTIVHGKIVYERNR